MDARSSGEESRQEHDREDEYLDYRLLHHFVHGSHFAAIQRTTIPQQGFVLIGGAAADAAVWADPAALVAAQSMLYAVRGLSTILGAPEPPEIQALLERIEALAMPES